MYGNRYKEYDNSDRKQYKKSRYRRKSKRMRTRYLKWLNTTYPERGVLVTTLRQFFCSG